MHMARYLAVKGGEELQHEEKHIDGHGIGDEGHAKNNQRPGQPVFK